MPTVVSFFGDHSPVFRQLNEQAQVYAASRGLDYVADVQDPYDRSRVLARLAHADAGIIDIHRYDRDFFAQLTPRTRTLIRFGVGYDAVDIAAATDYGVAIGRTVGANTWAVAELAMMLILGTRRRLAENMASVRAGQWGRFVGHELRGSTVGIIGFGAIGQALATLLRGFDVRLLVCDPVVPPQVLSTYQAQAVSLAELLRQSDAVSLHVPYLPETHHLINRERLQLMKPEAVIVNTARGGVIDEVALAEALHAGTVGGAGIDVFATEPLPADSALRHAPNVMLTPHGASQTVESLWRIYAKAIDIAAGVLSGECPAEILNPEALTPA